MYDKFVGKVNNIDTSWFVLETKFMPDKSDLEKKISDADKKFLILVELLKTYYNAKITEIQGKIPNISGLPTNSALTGLENKVGSVSNLPKKQIITQKLMKFKKKLLIMIMKSILMFQNLIS